MRKPTYRAQKKCWIQAEITKKKPKLIIGLENIAQLEEHPTERTPPPLPWTRRESTTRHESVVWPGKKRGRRGDERAGAGAWPEPGRPHRRRRRAVDARHPPRRRCVPTRFPLPCAGDLIRYSPTDPSLTLSGFAEIPVPPAMAVKTEEAEDPAPASTLTFSLPLHSVAQFSLFAFRCDSNLIKAIAKT